jgi:hypothetical protein
MNKGSLFPGEDQPEAVLTDPRYDPVVVPAGSGKKEMPVTRMCYLAPVDT